MKNPKAKGNDNTNEKSSANLFEKVLHKESLTIYDPSIVENNFKAKEYTRKYAINNKENSYFLQNKNR